MLSASTPYAPPTPLKLRARNDDRAPEPAWALHDDAFRPSPAHDSVGVRLDRLLPSERTRTYVGDQIERQTPPLLIVCAWCRNSCMRTNIVLNDELLAAAQRYARVKSKSAVVETALRAYVELKEQQERREHYADRLLELQRRLAKSKLTTSSLDILREDRSR